MTSMVNVEVRAPKTVPQSNPAEASGRMLKLLT